MKYINRVLILISVSLFIISCSRDLPYPKKHVRDGVVVDITAVSGSDLVLSDGVVAGNFQTKISIPTQQGDYSHLGYVEVLAVLRDVKGQHESKVVGDKVETFPSNIKIDIKEVYKSFGKSAPIRGETLYITTNSVLKNGYVINGWTKETGFNNKGFSGWVVDDRPYSYHVRYPVVCSLVLEDFNGSMDMVFGETIMPITCEKISDNELLIKGFEDKYEFKIKVNPLDHTVVVDKQILDPVYNQYTNLYILGKGTIDACNKSISLILDRGVDQGTFYRDRNWILTKK